eukprot:6178655-Pleurochrysis_carterae.AAC.2
MCAHESRAWSSLMDGISHMGPCRACKNNGDATWPLSAGCSKRYSEPASRPARRSDAVRSTKRFACCSSRWCGGGTSGRPVMWSRSRTGGGPPSGTSALKKRLIEKVEQGREATIAANAPAEQRSSSRE